MNWSELMQYLPEGLCFLVCLCGCVCTFLRTGSMKKMLQTFCPSSQPVQELQSRVDDLEFYQGAPLHEELSAFAEINALYDRVGALEVQMSEFLSVLQALHVEGDQENGNDD